jgi:hypothetical protein
VCVCERERERERERARARDPDTTDPDTHEPTNPDTLPMHARAHRIRVFSPILGSKANVSPSTTRGLPVILMATAPSLAKAARGLLLRSALNSACMIPACRNSMYIEEVKSAWEDGRGTESTHICTAFLCMHRAVHAAYSTWSFCSCHYYQPGHAKRAEANAKKSMELLIFLILLRDCPLSFSFI